MAFFQNKCYKKITNSIVYSGGDSPHFQVSSSPFTATGHKKRLSALQLYQKQRIIMMERTPLHTDIHNHNIASRRIASPITNAITII